MGESIEEEDESADFKNGKKQKESSDFLDT
jgi:hypothetical protein